MVANYANQRLIELEKKYPSDVDSKKRKKRCSTALRGATINDTP